jgi:MFS family permease
VASAFAPDTAWLIGLRALAGVGAAATFPVTLSALIDAYPEDRRGFAVAVWSGVSAAGAVLGTLVAGALLEVSGWGSVQLAFGVGALVLLPAVGVLVAQHRNRALSLDPLGALWAVVALTGLVYGVIEAPQVGWTSWRRSRLSASALRGSSGSCCTSCAPSRRHWTCGCSSTGGSPAARCW